MRGSPPARVPHSLHAEVAGFAAELKDLGGGVAACRVVPSRGLDGRCGPRGAEHARVAALVGRWPRGSLGAKEALLAVAAALRRRQASSAAIAASRAQGRGCAALGAVRSLHRGRHCEAGAGMAMAWQQRIGSPRGRAPCRRVKLNPSWHQTCPRGIASAAARRGSKRRGDSPVVARCLRDSTAPRHTGPSTRATKAGTDPRSFPPDKRA